MNIVMIGSFAFAPKATVTSSAATAAPRSAGCRRMTT